MIPLFKYSHPLEREKEEKKKGKRKKVIHLKKIIKYNFQMQ